MTRPVDWSPLAHADPVPGNPLEVASIGGQLTNVAAQIHADVTWLQSLCTAQFWDSDAGQAFQGQVDNAAAKLAKAHERYLSAGQALGTSPVAPAGYASALEQAQTLSLQALTQAQGAWAVMRTQLAAAEIANKGMVPYEGSNLYATLNPTQPLVDSSGNPVMMFTPADATTPLRTAVARYNASALDYRTANGWLAEAIAARDAAAASAARGQAQRNQLPQQDHVLRPGLDRHPDRYAVHRRCRQGQLGSHSLRQGHPRVRRAQGESDQGNSRTMTGPRERLTNEQGTGERGTGV